MDELEHDLEETAAHIAHLSRRVYPDPTHRAQLRQELLRRHQELSAGYTQRPVIALWSRLTGLKRLTLVAPPALAGLAALVVALFLPLAPQQSPQAAEAARITTALARTAPTVTAWQVTSQQQRGNSSGSLQCTLRLAPTQRLYVRGDRTYMYSGGSWYEISPDSWSRGTGCRGEGGLQIAFALLPVHLAHSDFTMLPSRTIDGHAAAGIRYAVPHGKRTTTFTVWVDRSSGLVRRAVRVVSAGHRTLETDTATYTYERTR